MLSFRPELADAVMDGRKTETRRALSDNPRSPWFRERCGHEVGTRHAVCPGRGAPNIGHIIIDGVQLVRLGAITPDGARREGFDSVEAFRAGWEKLNGPWNDRQRVWRVRFHVETAADRALA